MALQLTARDPLHAHARDELGISDALAARPLQAAFSSAAAFSVGAALPIVAASLAPQNHLSAVVAATSLVCLAALGALAARTGGAPAVTGAARVCFWGAIAMVVTAGVGRLFGAVVTISARLAGVLEMARTELEGVLFGGEATATEQERGQRIASCFAFGDSLGLKIESTKKAWQTAVLKAHGYEPKWIAGGKLSEPSRAALNRINLRFHDLRHECGSRLIEAGWPVHHVKEMLGHQSLEQTTTYLNVTLGGLKDSMRKSDETAARCKPVASIPSTDPGLSRNDNPAGDANSLIH